MPGYTINQLPTATELSAGNQIPVFLPDEGSAYKASLATLLAFFSENFASPEFETQTSAPTSTGFTMTLTSSASSIWALIAPTGAFASGTVVLPAVADAFDGQQILITSTAGITALTISPNGATLSNVPTGITAGGGSILLRFNDLTSTWYCVAMALPAGLLTSQAMALTTTGALTVTAGAASTMAVTGTLTLFSTGKLSLSSLSSTVEVGTTLDVTTFAIKQTAGTVAGLGGPSGAAAAGAGARRFVTDANATTFASIVASGGSNGVPVYSDGTNWRIG